MSDPGQGSPRQPLGYADVAFTVADYPTSVTGDSHYDAIHLATSDDLIAAKKDWLWEAYGLNDPEKYRFFRTHVPLGDVLAGAAYRNNGCIYCGERMICTETEYERMPDSPWLCCYLTAICKSCGWWLVTFHQESLGIYGIAEEDTHAYAVLKRFDPTALDAPLHLTREYLAHNPHRLARFDPYRFEELMADCLRDYFGGAEIVKLGGRQDGGIDIKAIRANGQTVLIQTKRRGDFGRKEGVQVVRELHGVMLREGVPRGMVITTAHDFSSAAQAEAAQVDRRLKHYSMELVSLDGVIDLLGAFGEQSRQPWVEFGIQTKGRVSWRASEDWIERSALPDTYSLDR